MSRTRDYYFDQLVRGRITRREFTGRMTAAGLSATHDQDKISEGKGNNNVEDRTSSCAAASRDANLRGA